MTKTAKRLFAMAREYRRLRRLASGVSFTKVEAFGLAIANTERDRRFRR